MREARLKKALDDLSVHIKPGEFVTILGCNGAGKSTFFNVISGKAPLKTERLFWTGRILLLRNLISVQKLLAVCTRILLREQLLI